MKKLITVVLSILLVSSVWVWSAYQQALDDVLNIDSDEIIYSIKSGSSLSAVVYDLNKKRIIKHPRYILLYARLNGLANEMQAGDYSLSSKLKTSEFLDNIFKGKVIQYSLTVIEGWSFKQLIEAVNNHPELKTYYK